MPAFSVCSGVYCEEEKEDSVIGSASIYRVSATFPALLHRIKGQKEHLKSTDDRTISLSGGNTGREYTWGTGRGERKDVKDDAQGMMDRRRCRRRRKC